VSCSISILDDTPREAFWPGVIIGLTGTSPCRWYAVVFSRRNEVTEDRLNVVRRDHNKPGERLSVAIPRSESFHVRVQVWDEQIVVFVNDKMRFAGSIDAGQDLDFGARFALGNVGAKGKGVAVYSKMQLRLLSDRPQQLEHPTILKAKE
jgi:hypothetical protein